MKINTLNNIYFKSTNQPMVPLSQQQQYKVNFERENKIAEKADSIDANPITALGYKLYRAFGFITEKDSVSEKQNFKAVA